MAINKDPILKRCKSLQIDPSHVGIFKESKRTSQRNSYRKMSEYGIQLREKQKADNRDRRDRRGDTRVGRDRKSEGRDRKSDNRQSRDANRSYSGHDGRTGWYKIYGWRNFDSTY